MIRGDACSQNVRPVLLADTSEMAHAHRTLAQVLEPLVEMPPVSHPSFYLQVVRMINTLTNHNSDSIRSIMKEVLHAHTRHVHRTHRMHARARLPSAPPSALAVHLAPTSVHAV